MYLSTPSASSKALTEHMSLLLFYAPLIRLLSSVFSAWGVAWLYTY